MSQFLAPYFDSIPLGYSILQMQNALVGNLTTNGWQLLAQSDGNWSDVIPPATETIGTSKFREVTRIYFPDNVTIKIGSYQECISDALPQSFQLTALNGGAVADAVTIGGVTVTGATGGAGATANDNLRALYYALRDSVDATITGWSFWYNGTNTLVATKKTVTAAVTISSNANVTYAALDAPVLSGARSSYAKVDVSLGFGITTDLTNGFVYYMDVWSRSFTIGTKCLSGVTGQIFASYVDHAEALAVMPENAGDLCTPIELIVGNLSDGAGTAKGRPTHWWILPTSYGTQTVPNTDATYIYSVGEAYGDAHSFTGGMIPRRVSDGGVSYKSGVGYCYGDALTFSGLLERDDINTIPVMPTLGVAQFKTAPMSVPAKVMSSSSYYSQSIRFIPAINLPDIHKWYGSEPNEAAAMTTLAPTPSGVSGIKLQTVMDDTSTYSTVTFDTVVGLEPTGGDFIIGTEQFTYAAASGTTATGVTRGQNGTAQARHFLDDAVYPVLWFLKVNSSAVCSGSAKPV